MATHIWTNASGDGDLANTANYDSGAVPSTGDELLFSLRSVGPPTKNMDTFTGASFTLALLYAGEDSNVDVGQPGNPLKVDIITKAVNQGKGSMNLECTTITRAICNSDHPKGTPAMSIDNTTTLTALVCDKGDVFVGPAVTTLTRVLMGYRDNRFGDVSLTVGTSSSAIAEFRQVGGTAELNRLPTLCSVEDGALTVLDTAPAATVTLIEVAGASLVEYNNAQTITRVNVYGGTFDTTGVTNPLTITNIAVWPNATFKRSDDLVTYGGGAVVDDLTGGDI